MVTPRATNLFIPGRAVWHIDMGLRLGLGLSPSGVLVCRSSGTLGKILCSVKGSVPRVSLITLSQSVEETERGVETISTPWL